MIEVNKEHVLSESSSKGNQIKFLQDNRWYKVDQLGYEGLAETVVSNILQYSNLESFVKYQEEEFQYHGKTLLGCSSENFKPENADLITASTLFKQYFGKSTLEVCQKDTLEATILNCVHQLSRMTKLPEQEIGQYLTGMIEADSFVLNEDRHFNNIAFLRYENMYIPAPLFDFGDSLLSNCNYEFVNLELDEKIEKAGAKPFSKDFMEQKHILEYHYGQQLKLYIDEPEIILPKKSLYPEKYIDQIYEIIDYQIDKYPELINTLDRDLSRKNKMLEKSRENSFKRDDREIER